MESDERPAFREPDNGLRDERRWNAQRPAELSVRINGPVMSGAGLPPESLDLCLNLFAGSTDKDVGPLRCLQHREGAGDHPGCFMAIDSDGGTDRRRREQLQTDRNDDAERAERSDAEAGQVVPGDTLHDPRS